MITFLVCTFVAGISFWSGQATSYSHNLYSDNICISASNIGDSVTTIASLLFGILLGYEAAMIVSSIHPESIGWAICTAIIAGAIGTFWGLNQAVRERANPEFAIL